MCGGLGKPIRYLWQNSEKKLVFLLIIYFKTVLGFFFIRNHFIPCYWSQIWRLQENGHMTKTEQYCQNDLYFISDIHT